MDRDCLVHCMESIRILFDVIKEKDSKIKELDGLLSDLSIDSRSAKLALVYKNFLNEICSTLNSEIFYLPEIDSILYQASNYKLE